MISRKLHICLIVVFSLLHCTGVQSQTKEEKQLIDSLRKVTRNPVQLKSVCFQLLKSNQDVTLFEANYGLGYAHLITNELDSALYYYQAAKKKQNFLIIKTK